MILSVENAKKLASELSIYDDEVLQMKLNALELMIRKYTNNSFQNRNVRFTAQSVGNVLNGASPFIKEGDTIQISESKVNDGIYLVNSITDESTVIDKAIYMVDHNLVTKIEYPDDIKQGVLNMLKYDVQMEGKQGIKSETISRHSVTYADVDSDNQVMGYPVQLLGFLKPYMRARF